MHHTLLLLISRNFLFSGTATITTATITDKPTTSKIVAKKKKIPEGGNVPKNRRQCRVCGKVFKSRRGLIFHRKKQSSSDLCRRFGDLSTKISSISSYKDRLEKAKQTQPKEIKDLLKANNDVIFKLKQGVKYCELAKKLCINLTQVSIYF